MVQSLAALLDSLFITLFVTLVSIAVQLVQIVCPRYHRAY